MACRPRSREICVGRGLERGEHRVEQPVGAEAHRIVGDEARLGLGRRDRRARAASSSSCARVERDAATFALRAGSEIRSCRSTSSGSGEQRMARDSPRSRSRPARWQSTKSVRRRAVDQPERDARVRGMGERALALDEQQLAAALVALDDEPLGRAGDEVGDDRVDGDPPARDRDPRLAGRDEARVEPARPRRPRRARARRSSSRSRSRSRP